MVKPREERQCLLQLLGLVEVVLSRDDRNFYRRFKTIFFLVASVYVKQQQRAQRDQSKRWMRIGNSSGKGCVIVFKESITVSRLCSGTFFHILYWFGFIILMHSSSACLIGEKVRTSLQKALSKPFGAMKTREFRHLSCHSHHELEATSFAPMYACTSTKKMDICLDGVMAVQSFLMAASWLQHAATCSLYAR